jgi:RNA polymerase sigma factor (sigma-70 family)
VWRYLVTLFDGRKELLPDVAASVVTTTPLDDDAVLVRRSLTDPEQFAGLYDRHARVLHRYAAKRLGSQAAEDVVAEAFLAAFRRRHRYDTSRPDALPWLFGILTREVSRRRRDERAHYRLLAATPPDLPQAGHADDVAAAVTAGAARAPLTKALAELKAADRDVLLLVAWADLTYQEVADALGVPIGTVRSRLNRARRLVRAALADLPLTTAEEA